MPFDYAGFEAELDALGEPEVRAKYRRDEYLNHAIKNRFVQDWLREKDDVRRDEREEETISIARDANRIASRAERWAMYAAIAAVIALIVSIARSNS